MKWHGRQLLDRGVSPLRIDLQRFAAAAIVGDVDTLPEGAAFFANESVVRVTAPLPQAQLVETRLINLLHLQTPLASKAARCVLAAGGRDLIDRPRYGFAGFRNSQVGPFALERRLSRVASGNVSASATATYQAS